MITLRSRGKTLVFFEVKTRSSFEYGNFQNSVKLLNYPDNELKALIIFDRNPLKYFCGSETKQREKKAMVKRMIWLLLIGIAACSGGKTVIRSDPPTAFVTINEIPKGVTPLEIKLNCDKTKDYKIKISYPGYQAQTKDIECGYIRGAKKEIFFELEPGKDTTSGETPSVPQNPGDFTSIKIKSMPSEAEIYLDNKMIGTSPLIKKKIKPGAHLLEVRKQGFKTWREEIQITPDSEQEFFPILEAE